MTGGRTVEERVFQRFLAKVETDRAVPLEVAKRLRTLCEAGEIRDVNRILDAIQEGVREHAKNSAP